MNGLDEKTKKMELSEEELGVISGGLSYHRGNTVSKYHIQKGHFYYIRDSQTDTLELVMAQSDNQEEYYWNLCIHCSSTVANVLWVTGKHKGKSEKYVFSSKGGLDEIYDAVQD